MLGLTAEFLRDGLDTALSAIRSLALPAFYFLVLGLLLKRAAFLADLRRVWKESGLNLQLLIFDAVFVMPVIGVIAGVLNGYFTGKGWSSAGAAIWQGLPAPLVVLAAVFLGDFIGYWRHRLEHTTVLWPAHAVHHSDTEMTWLTLARFPR